MAQASFVSKIDSRGRTIVPPEVLEHLGITAGGTVVYRVRDDGTVHLSARSAAEPMAKGATR